APADLRHRRPARLPRRVHERCCSAPDHQGRPRDHHVLRRLRRRRMQTAPSARCLRRRRQQTDMSTVEASMELRQAFIAAIVAALEEDLGTEGLDLDEDITTRSTVPGDLLGRANVYA